jgi:hypothetical protein
MNTNIVLEICPSDLKQINGGLVDANYESGKAAGEVAGQFVGTMINDFLKISGIWKLISFF